MRQRIWPGILCLLLFLLCGCSRGKEEPVSNICHIGIEEGSDFTVVPSFAAVERGQPVSFVLRPREGVEITGCDVPEAALVHEADGTLRLTLAEARYSTVIRLNTVRAACSIRYHANGGILVKTEPAAEGSAGEMESLLVPQPSTHLRFNTAMEGELFVREGYTQLCWNTRPDGTGERIGLGSRADIPEGETLDLYAIWLPWADAKDFEWETTTTGVRITGYTGEDAVLSVPGKLDGKEVAVIGERAFAGAPCTEAVLPPTVRKVELYAFSDTKLRALTIPDSLTEISGYALADCPDFSTLYINAVEQPAYSGSYYDTFPDKYDYLRSIRGEKKLVLFSGSSTRFGYDSALLDEALPDYEVANMGVFAYTNAIPQLELMLPLLKAGDILLVSPEFDAAKRQFCTTREMDDDFFCMVESNYDLVSLLDLRTYTGVLDAFSSFLSVRRGMERKDHTVSASWFDEDGNPVSSPSYNRYGDYIVPRPDAGTDDPVYGLPVEYTVKAFPKELYLDSFNKEYRLFTERGIHVWFTYAPRNRQAVSEESTPEERKRLDSWLREGLCVPVISPLEESLFPGHLLSGTDNHLSDAGVQIRTEHVLRDIQRQLAGGRGDKGTVLLSP